MWLSVILPVYNTSDCLCETLTSIEMQYDKEGVQFILVDDGSTDASSEYLDQFYNKYKDQTILIRQKNSGLSAARNAGLNAANGTYIYFMDGDDCLCENAFSSFRKMAEMNKTFDLASFCAETFSHNSGEVLRHLTDEFIGRKVFAGPKDICDFSLRAYVMGGTILRHAVWNKLYRADIIRSNRIVFKPTFEIGAEDLLFNLEYLSCCKRIEYVSDCIYRYRVNRPTSIMGQYDGKVMIKRSFRLFSLYRRFLIERNPGILNETYKGKPLYNALIYAFIISANRQFYRMKATDLVELFCEREKDKDISYLCELVRTTGKDSEIKNVMFEDEYRGFMRHRFLILHPYIGKFIAPIYEKIRH